GRKRFAACDIRGNLLESLVLPANTGERAGAWVLLERLKMSPLSQTMALIRADEGFAGADWEARVNARFGWPVEIIRKPKEPVGFAVLPRRWIIEQTFGCWGRYRRLSKDYEQNPSCSRAMLLLTAIRRALQSLEPAPSHDPPFKTRHP
ncbi:MAG TPA: DDE transposase, partial [Armatimonadetes bacterium]|nr:DDE transposase [Armatimonadota bacterium]